MSALEKGAPCSATVFKNTGNWGHRSPCRKHATVMRDGKPWCATHDPERVKARRAEATARFEAKWDRARRETELSNARSRLADAALAWRDDRSKEPALLAACKKVDAALQKLIGGRP